MEVVVQESLERRQRAAKHLLKTSTLDGLIDVDQLREEAEAYKAFELDESQILYKVFQAIMGVRTDVSLNDILLLSTLDRYAALHALKMAYSIEEAVHYEAIQ